MMSRLTCMRAVIALCLTAMLFWACSSDNRAAVTEEKKSAGKTSLESKTNAAVLSDGAGDGETGTSADLPGGPERLDIESVTVEPESPVSGDQLKAVITARSPGENRAKLRCRWKVNGRVVQDSQEEVLNYSVVRGDYVEIEANLEDGADCGNWASHYVYVGNAYPVVQLVSQGISKDGLYEALLEVSDEEGDEVALSLKKFPDGMTLDADKRVLRWSVLPEMKAFDVEVVARDRHGAETLLGFGVEMGSESQEGGGS